MDEFTANCIISCDEKYQRRLKVLADQIHRYKRQIIVDQNKQKSWWEVEIDKIYYHPAEMIKLNQLRIEELMEERSKRIKTILKGDDGTSIVNIREDDSRGEIPTNKRNAIANTTTFQTNTTI